VLWEHGLQSVKSIGRSSGQGAHSAKTGAAPQSSTAHREEIDRILQGATFRGRDSLKRLLAYLADRTIDGSADDLKEYTIGVEVFHKLEGYDPQQDGSVRQHVAKLRQKLDEYYRSEGSADPIRIELPKRQFRLEFQGSHQPQVTYRRPVSQWAIACLILLLPAAYWLGSLRHAAPQPDPAVRLLWAPFLDSPRPTVMCLGAPLFLRNRSFRVRDSHLNATDTPEAQARIQELQKKLGLDSFVPTYDYTGIGEAYAAVSIARVFAEAQRQASLTRANVLPWNDIRDENVIFLGPPKFNPHLAAITDNLELTVRDAQVINTHPATGESATYARIHDNNRDAAEDYVLIDRLPGIGPSDRILILEGGSTSSNWAAADYLTQPATAKALVSRIKLSDGTIPPFFQALLHVKYQATVPTQTDFVLFRQIHPK
jgi:hypothetical protein